MEQVTVSEDEKKRSIEKQPEALVFPSDGFADVDGKQLILRIDFLLIPWLSLLYILCFLDRIGIGNARLYGLERDLGISDSQYLLALSLFFVPYALFEVPSNLILWKLRPSIWLSTIMTLWGIVTICSGLVENFAGLLSLRILLGILEAGFLPGITYYLSCWYRRNELGLRMAVFTSSVSCAGAFGGLLAAAISNMGGIGGKSAWSWIFIIEGLFTSVAGIASFIILQDFPESARFLSKRERAFIVRRLKEDDQFSAGGEKPRFKDVKKSLTDYKTWLGTMLAIGVGGPTYAFSLFLPTIIRQLGYTSTKANLLTVPVYFTASIFSCFIGYTADRLKRRGHINIMLNIISEEDFVYVREIISSDIDYEAGVGYIILLCSRKPALSYFATYVAAIGIFPGIANALTWVTNNTEGSYKRAVTIALCLACANLTGIISSNVYRRGDGPWYPIGNSITLGYAVIGFVGSVMMSILVRKENERRDRGEREEVIGDCGSGDPRNGIYGTVEAAKRDKGDKWSGFRYVT